jgi:uncharacterized protein (DUF2141 family)
MKKVFLTGICLLNLFLFGQVFSQVVEVRITGLKNKIGVIQLAVFTSQKNFENELATIEKTFPKEDAVNGELVVVIELKPGTYGLALLDDEDCNGKMKYNILGLPLEGFGFSNFKSTGFSKPSFSDFSFLAGNEKMVVHVNMRYVLF